MSFWTSANAFVASREAMPIGMQARAIVTELNGIRHVRESSLFARVDLRHALHHASREVHGGGAPNALQ